MNPNLAKILDFISPLMILTFMGLIMIGYGFVNPSQENNVVQFIFGIPLALGAAGGHFLIRRLVNYNVLYMWIIEAIMVGFFIYVFLKS